jgi:hypothetical protein
MSGTAPAEESWVNAALVRAMLRKRKSTAVLYWRFVRPRARIYGVAWAKFVAYRTAAAVTAIIVLVFASFDGSMLGAVGYPRWPQSSKINAGMITAAVVQASSYSSRLAPVILALGLVLVIIPRPHRWHFAIVLLGVIALGYFASALPPLARSKLSDAISGRVASAAHTVLSQETGTTPLYSLVLLAGTIVVIGYLLYRSCYTLALRTADLIPHRPRNHRRSTFMAVSVARRLIAAIVTGVLFAVSLWLVESGRLVLPVTRHATPGPWHVQFTLIEWMVLTVVAGLVVCGSRPNGNRWLLVALLTIMTVSAFWPHNAFPLPVGISAAPFGFWPLVIAYFAVIGMAFDVAAALLDWPL